MNGEQRPGVPASTKWIIAGVVVCGGIGAALGAAIGLVGLGAGPGLAVGAVLGFLIGVPSDDD